MVKVLSEHFITGACHAPVDSRQGESREGAVGSWLLKDEDHFYQELLP